MSFKIGDVVKVVDLGKIYSHYVPMSEKMNLKNWQCGISVKSGEIFKIVAIEKHFENYEIIFGIKSLDTKKELMINGSGLELLSPTPKPTPKPTATECISEALSIVGGDRQSLYGNQKTNFRKYAKITNSLLDKTEIESLRSGKITDTIVCKVLMSIKLGRHAYKPKKDNMVDLIGYASILHELQTKGVQNG